MGVRLYGLPAGRTRRIRARRAPSCYGLAAHFEFARNVLDLQSACTQQQPGCPDPEIAMTVVQRQLLQGVPLNISQFYGALHQQAQCGDACEVNKNQTRLLATLSGRL